MARNHEEKVYPGGLLNRINRITVRTGESNSSYNGPHTDIEINGVAQDPRSLISRTENEPPVSRKKNVTTKDNDV